MPPLPPTSQQSLPGSQPSTPKIPRPQYLPATILPNELRAHCKIYFEERLYVQALSLLHQTLAAGCATSTQVQVPHHQILSYIATLAIHPTLTAAHVPTELSDAANLSIHYLSHLNSVVGPINARFHDAFAFVSSGRRAAANRRNNAGRRQNERGAGSEDEPASEDEITGPLATHGSVWAYAQDFWHVVGWAFNASVKHPARWTRWKVWLRLVLMILEDDFEERWAVNDEAMGERNKLDDSDSSPLQDLLIDQFVGGPDTTKHGGLKRILRAIFAEGSDTDLNEFGEVFPNETKVKEVEKEVKIDHTKVNIDEGEFGDYFDDDEDEILVIKAEKATKTGTGNRMVSGTHASKDTASQPADDPDAMVLRRRLLILLSKFASNNESRFTSHDFLIDACEQYLRPLSLSRFANITAVTVASTTNPCFAPSSHISLLQEIVRPLIAGSAPAVKSYYLTQDVLQTAYLPFAVVQGSANNVVVDNAKVSLCLENMIRLLMSNVGITASGGKFKRAVEEGMQERRKKIEEAMDWRKKNNPIELEALQWLKGNEIRLALLVQMVERQAKME